MDSRAFLDAARAVLADSQWIAKGRISNDALFTAIEARLGVEKLPRRTWAKYLSSLGLKPARWDHGKVRGWRLPDVTPVDVTPDVTPVDVTPDVTQVEPPARRPKCRVRLTNSRAAGYITNEALLKAIKRHPELRPCPKANWWWRDWKYCEECDWKLPVPTADQKALAASEQPESPCGV